MDITYFTTYDLPVEYRGLNIYPISVKDYMYFSMFSSCLTVSKNEIPDVKIISMSELQYLYWESTRKNGAPYLLWLDRMLSLCLKDDESFVNVEDSILRYSYSESGKPIFKIGEEEYGSDDFLQLRQIISDQNSLELPDTNISKEVRDSLQKAKEYKRKLSSEKVGSLEDYIVSLTSVTGWTFDYVYNMPIRKFIKAIERHDNLLHYKIYLAASMSGMVDFKDKSFIIHWLSSLDKPKDAYGNVTVNLDELQEKISLESAKK